MIAWAVKFGRGLVALFIDHGRAVQYAAHSHGIIVELHGEESPTAPPADAVAASRLDEPDRS